jgi:hypothetical protein
VGSGPLHLGMWQRGTPAPLVGFLQDPSLSTVPSPPGRAEAWEAADWTGDETSHLV